MDNFELNEPPEALQERRNGNSTDHPKQYRLTIEHSQSIHDEFPTSRWSELAAVAEARGINIWLESRSIFEHDPIFLAGIVDPVDGRLPPGWMMLGKNIVTDWQYEAAIVSHG